MTDGELTRIYQYSLKGSVRFGHANCLYFGFIDALRLRLFAIFQHFQYPFNTAGCILVNFLGRTCSRKKAMRGAIGSSSWRTRKRGGKSTGRHDAAVQRTSCRGIRGRPQSWQEIVEFCLLYMRAVALEITIPNHTGRG